MSNAELAASVASLLPGAVLSGELAPDTRQSHFTGNGGQAVDPIYASQLQEALSALSARAAPALLASLGCHGPDECPERLFDWVARAWRRPISSAEMEDLRALYRQGALNAGDLEAVRLVIEGVLQAASFLYLSELGDDASGTGPARLTGDEIASSLAYLVTGAPPDATLLTAAAGGQLANAREREAEARRLLGAAGATRQLQRFVAEWLGTDALASTRKDNDVYPDFEPYRPYMIRETDAFIAEVLFRDQGTLSRLLTADFTMAEAPLADYYHLGTPSPTGRVALGDGPRRGLLTEGSFLAVHAHPDSSAPVRRGVAVLERLLCVQLPNPSELALTVVPPAPAPDRTTRARFEAHSQDPACTSCHAIIDPVGFAFEAFDGMGQVRATENGQPIATAGALHVAGLPASVANAADLAAKVAASPEAPRCLARNLFRFAAATTDAALEDAFLTSVFAPLAPERRDNLTELLVAWVASDMFVLRAVSP